METPGGVLTSIEVAGGAGGFVAHIRSPALASRAAALE